MNQRLATGATPRRRAPDLRPGPQGPRHGPIRSPDVIELGLAAALLAVFELTCTIGEFGRGERDRASLTQQSLRFVMISRTPRESFPAAAARSA